MYFALAVVIIVAVVLTTFRLRRNQRRRANPKDYGYRVCTGFGPELGRPRIERLTKHIPWVSEAQFNEWLPEFERVDKYLGELAEQGGPKNLGRKTVEQRIQERFPFLQHEGLRQAVFLVGYGAHHDGYER
jgi:hypothetical protein